MTARTTRRCTLLFATVLATACTGTAPGTGVFLLLDTSGTYSEELGGAQTVVNFLLGTLDPGDSFGVARIDSGSFSEKDILLRTTFDERPSVANDQKRHAMETVAQFADTVAAATHTDITGGVLQAVEWLNEVGSGRRTVLIFSDLEEDLPEGFVRDFPIALDGIEVVAINVTKLQPDNVDPREYMDRLEDWRERVVSGGGEWAVINDMERLPLALEL